MKDAVRSISCVAVLVLAMAGETGSPGLTAQQWMPPPPTNLEVIPADTEVRALVAMMRGYTRALGVRCQHCHVYKGDNPDDLTTFDFASDEKQPKHTARAMMRMVTDINERHLKDIGEHAVPGEAKVTCYTCHRGETMPLTRPDR